MRSDLLHVVTVYSNPIATYNKFERHVLDSGVNLTTAELVYGERCEELINHKVEHVKVKANAGALVWNKEIGAEHRYCSPSVLGEVHYHA